MCANLLQPLYCWELHVFKNTIFSTSKTALTFADCTRLAVTAYSVRVGNLALGNTVTKFPVTKSFATSPDNNTANPKLALASALAVPVWLRQSMRFLGSRWGKSNWEKVSNNTLSWKFSQSAFSKSCGFSIGFCSTYAGDAQITVCQVANALAIRSLLSVNRPEFIGDKIAWVRQHNLTVLMNDSRYFPHQ